MKREGIKSVIFFVLGVGMVSPMLVAPGTANALGPSKTPTPQPSRPVESTSPAASPNVTPPTVTETHGPPGTAPPVTTPVCDEFDVC